MDVRDVIIHPSHGFNEVSVEFDFEIKLSIAASFFMKRNPKVHLKSVVPIGN